MKYNRPLLYRLLKGFITEQEKNGIRMYPRINIQDCNVGDLEIKDAIILDGMVISSNTLNSIKATNVKTIDTGKWYGFTNTIIIRDGCIRTDCGGRIVHWDNDGRDWRYDWRTPTS